MKATKRPWLVLRRVTSYRTGLVGKWRVHATYATQSSAIDGMLRVTTDSVEGQVVHRDKREQFA